MMLAPGDHLGPYEIQAAIGAGAMGEVYRARDPRLGRDVAIKVLPGSFTTDPDRLRRFEQEARAAAALNHPNILAVYDLGAHDGVALRRLRASRGADAARAAGRRPVVRAEGRGVRRADCARARGGARQGDRAPGPQAREPARDGERPREDSRLRAGEAHRSGRGPLGARRDRLKPAAMPRTRRSRCRAWCSAPSATCRPSRSAACRLITDPTSLRSARFCTKCSRAAARSAATRPPTR